MLDTTNYMILGFTVIFGTIGLYLVTLWVRARNLKSDLAALIELDKESAQ